MEEVYERKVDYFLRYIADIPADEIKRHQAFSRTCDCRPSVEFDDLNGWHKLIHNRKG